MYSPGSIIDPLTNSHTNYSISRDLNDIEDALQNRNSNNYGMNSNFNNNGNHVNSVDSLLMMNQHESPPRNISANYYNESMQQQNSGTQNQQQVVDQNITYRRVRPDPVNEKTLVGSMVGYFHDVIGTSETYNKQQRSQGPKRLQQHNIFQSGSSTLLSKTPQNSCASEIKEQVEWLHFENINLLSSTSYTNNSWNIYNNKENHSTNNNNNNNTKNCDFTNSNILLILGYKTGFSIWTIDLNGVASEVLSIREPNITHVKLIQFENQNKILIAICKLILTDSSDPTPQSNGYHNNSNLNDNFSTSSISHSSSQPDLNQPENNPQIPSSYSEPQQTQQIAIMNLLNGECLHEILFNGSVLDMKSNADLLCVNSWNRIDAFDLNTFEHRFSLNCCFSQISKSSGKSTNPFSLGRRWLAFADKKFHVILSSQGGVSTDIEQSYAATVLNTAKSISKGLVKISETVVNSVVSKNKNSSSNCSSSDHSPRGHGSKNRHDSKEDFQPGICTIIDTKKYVSNSRKSQMLHDENQNWIVAHFLAHQEPIYALEFNHNGRLLVSADCLGQYFNVFQINTNSYKCTRTVVKHLYSLYRGDTTSKVRNISFSLDSRWLAIGTKRGTTHIFPLNSYGGVVNARTHSKSYLVNRTTKHHRTAGFVDREESGGNSNNSNINSLLSNTNLTQNEIQQHQMQQMLQQNYDNSLSSPVVYNNNPKLRSLMEPFLIPAYGQLKQPNTNSTFQSSVISTNATHNVNTGVGLLTSVNPSPELNKNGSNQVTNSTAAAVLNSSVANISLHGPNLAAAALSSAALATENMTHLASNTTNLIQYDNVNAIAIFGESRGYLSPEETRDNRPKPVNSLFIISDVNGNLVEYVLDIIIDTSKTLGNKATNDSPIQLKITPKAQWPLQRLVASDELRYPILPDNPLLFNSLNQCKKRNDSKDSSLEQQANINSLNGFSSNSGSSINSIQPAPNTLLVQTSNNDDWIKQIEVQTHVGPHRRLFMGPQFVFKTFNSNLTTTKLTSSSSSVISDVTTSIIDLSGDIELNTLDLSANTITNLTARKDSTQPLQIKHSLSKTLKAQQKFDCTPTYIEVGAGSFQEGMPVLCGSQGSRGSQKSLNKDSDLLGDSLVDSLADAMNDLNTSHNQQNAPFNRARQMHHAMTNGNGSSAAIAITNTSSANHPTKLNQPTSLLMNANQNNHQNVQTMPILTPSSTGSNCSVFTPGSYFMINPALPGAANVDTTLKHHHHHHQTTGTNLHHTSSASFTSSGSSSSNNSSNINNEDDNSSASSNSSSIHNSLTLAKQGIDLHGPYHRNDAPSLENIQFQQDDINLLH